MRSALLVAFGPVAVGVLVVASMLGLGPFLVALVLLGLMPRVLLSAKGRRL